MWADWLISSNMNSSHVFIWSETIEQFHLIAADSIVSLDANEFQLLDPLISPERVPTLGSLLVWLISRRPGPMPKHGDSTCPSMRTMRSLNLLKSDESTQPVEIKWEHSICFNREHITQLVRIWDRQRFTIWPKTDQADVQLGEYPRQSAASLHIYKTYGKIPRGHSIMTCTLALRGKRPIHRPDRLDKVLNCSIVFVYLTTQSAVDNAHCLHWRSHPLHATVYRDSTQKFHDDLITTDFPSPVIGVGSNQDGLTNSSWLALVSSSCWGEGESAIHLQGGMQSEQQSAILTKCEKCVKDCMEEPLQLKASRGT
jgi:hypothetical protein